jgi:hypothetical protein
VHGGDFLRLTIIEAGKRCARNTFQEKCPRVIQRLRFSERAGKLLLQVGDIGNKSALQDLNLRRVAANPNSQAVDCRLKDQQG